MFNRRCLAFIAIAVLLLSACSQTIVVVTATLSASPEPSATLLPTAALRPTVTPPPTVPVVLPPTPTEPGYSPQTACDHPYLPLRAGASWTYLITTDKDQNYQAREIRTATTVTGDQASATATVHIEQTKDQRVQYSADVTYTCGPEGYAISGDATVVPWARFEPGAAWENERKWTQEAADGCRGAGDYTQTFLFKVEAVIGIKSVAGTFDGILMTQTGSLSSGPRTSTTGCAESTGSRTWLVPGIGRVRSEHTLIHLDGTYHSTTVYDLESYSIP